MINLDEVKEFYQTNSPTTTGKGLRWFIDEHNLDIEPVELKSKLQGVKRHTVRDVLLDEEEDIKKLITFYPTKYDEMIQKHLINKGFMKIKHKKINASLKGLGWI